MQRAWGLLWKPPHVGLPLALASLLAVAALAAFPQVADGFSLYFDGPIFLVLVAGATISTLSLAVLRGQNWFQQAPNTTPAAFWAAMLFGVIIILADSLLRYPADIIAAPSALLFYLAIAIPAQAFLHLAPLAALVFLSRRFGASNFWPPLLLPSAIEPMFQISGAFAAGAFSSRDALPWCTSMPSASLNSCCSGAVVTRQCTASASVITWSGTSFGARRGSAWGGERPPGKHSTALPAPAPSPWSLARSAGLARDRPAPAPPSAARPLARV